MGLFKRAPKFKGIQGLFQRPEQAIEAGAIKHLLGNGSVYRGDSSFKSGVKIDGVYEGNLAAESGVVWITPTGRVKGNVSATEIYVEGVIDGEAKAQVIVCDGLGSILGRAVCDYVIMRNPTMMDIRAKIYSPQMARKLGDIGAPDSRLVILQGESRVQKSA